jgi:hypothetical protein
LISPKTARKASEKQRFLRFEAHGFVYPWPTTRLRSAACAITTRAGAFPSAWEGRVCSQLQPDCVRMLLRRSVCCPCGVHLGHIWGPCLCLKRAWCSLLLFGVSVGLSGVSCVFPGAFLGSQRGRRGDMFSSWMWCVLRSVACNDASGVFCFVSGSFSGRSGSHFGARSSPDDPVDAKHARCIIYNKL